VAQPLTIGMVTAGFVVVGWLVWAVLVCAVAADIGRHAAKALRALPRLRLPGPLQSLSATVLGTVAVTSSAAAVGPAVHHATTHLGHPDQVTPTLAAYVSTGSRAAGRPVVQVAMPVTSGSGAQPQPASASSQPALHTVRHGETLWGIARDRLGNPLRWPEIYQLNRARYDQQGRMRHGEHIEPGWVLALPADAQPGAAATPPPVQADPPAPGAPPPPAQPTSPPSAAGPTTPAAPSPRSPHALPPTARATDGSTDTASLPRSALSASARPHAQGVELPGGGWAAPGLAAALTGVAALVWLHRRHQYTSGGQAGPVFHDPDPRPLPATIAGRRREVRRRPPQPVDANPAPARGTPAQDATVETPDQQPATNGASGTELASLAPPLPTGGLGLTGDGAHAAARALLIATLSSGGPDDPDARGRVVIPRDTLTTLLGSHDTAALHPTPRLSITSDLGEALARLEELLIARRRTLHEEDVDDLPALRTTDPLHPPMPQVLLVAEAPDPQAHARLATTLQLGGPLQINGVLLGDWPGGASVDVDAAGYPDTEGAGRFGVLDTETARQFLGLTGEVHSGPAAPSSPLDAPAPAAAHSREPDVALVGSPPQHVVGAAAGSPAPHPAPPRDQAVPTPSRGRPQPADPTAEATTTGPRVLIRVLGRPTIANDSPPKHALRPRARELMVYLAVHRSGVNLPDLKEAFWPDATNRRAGERLQTEVTDLRGRIRDVYGKRDIEPVVNTGGRYHLNPEVVEVDWWTVQDALAAATTDATRRRDQLRRAVHAFGGPLSEGSAYDWLPEVEERVRRQGIIAHTQLAELLADADPHEAAQLFDRATNLDPYNEDLARRAMRAHARLHDNAAVGAHYHRIRAALEELDLEPDPQTDTLAGNLLRHTSTPPPRPSAPPDDPDGV
jgi:DNA-binding SARP family transcriptional activator